MIMHSESNQSSSIYAEKQMAYKLESKLHEKRKVYDLRNCGQHSIEHHKFEEYSFNKVMPSAVKIEQSQADRTQADKTFQASSSKIENQSAQIDSDLKKKYSSLYGELKHLSPSEILQLFIEQIQENQNTNQTQFKYQAQIAKLEEEIYQLKSIIEKKRDSIATLCMTETNNLNLIEKMEMKLGSKSINQEFHYEKKYKELEKYMNQYINSTNEAQEEFKKNFALLKGQNTRLFHNAQKMRHQKYQMEKLTEINEKRVLKLQNNLKLLRERQSTIKIRVDNLEEENQMLKKQLQSLYQNIKEADRFEIDLAKENKELSSELDFIREKINENQNLSKDIFQKLEENSEQYQKLAKQNEILTKENEILLKQNEILIKDNQTYRKQIDQLAEEKLKLASDIAKINEKYRDLKLSYEQIFTQNKHLSLSNDEKDDLINKLNEQIKSLTQAQLQLIDEYQNQKQDKQEIKSQLIQLAQQVRLMESTYKKELIQNEKIKEQLHKFWEKKDSRHHQSELTQLRNISQTNYHLNSHIQNSQKESRLSQNNSTELNSKISQGVFSKIKMTSDCKENLSVSSQ